MGLRDRPLGPIAPAERKWKVQSPEEQRRRIERGGGAGRTGGEGARAVGGDARGGGGGGDAEGDGACGGGARECAAAAARAAAEMEAKAQAAEAERARAGRGARSFAGLVRVVLVNARPRRDRARPHACNVISPHFWEK